MEGPYTSKEAVFARMKYLNAKAWEASVAFCQYMEDDDRDGMCRMSSIRENCHEEDMHLLDELYRLLPLGDPYWESRLGSDINHSQGSA